LPPLDITLLDGTLQFEARTDSAGHHLRVDYFFRSLAKVQGSKAVAVILSGMGSDGTAGLKAIKENGGTTFAQDEPSAQHHSMPHNAIDSGYVDVVTTPRKIAAELARLARNRPPKSRKRPRIAESVIQDLTDLQRLKQDVVAISEEEQRRFGRDLHDSHCQDLTAISFFAESIAASLDAKDPDSAGQIRTLGEMVRKSAEGLHMLAASLSSQNVAQLGLIKALEELASRTSQRFGVACAVKADREDAIRDNVLAVHLYRIAQEAMSNAARHSQAKGIDIKVRLEGGRGILKIRRRWGWLLGGRQSRRSGVAHDGVSRERGQRSPQDCFQTGFRNSGYLFVSNSVGKVVGFVISSAGHPIGRSAGSVRRE
jgi:signal transduction histidine kinase